MLKFSSLEAISAIEESSGWSGFISVSSSLLHDENRRRPDMRVSGKNKLRFFIAVCF
jgi:hypothetical protein